MPSVNGLNITILHRESTFSYIIYLVHVARSKHGIHSLTSACLCTNISTTLSPAEEVVSCFMASKCSSARLECTSALLTGFWAPESLGREGGQW